MLYCNKERTTSLFHTKGAISMKYTYACKKVSLNESIKEYAEKKISKLERYFRRTPPPL